MSDDIHARETIPLWRRRQPLLLAFGGILAAVLLLTSLLAVGHILGSPESNGHRAAASTTRTGASAAATPAGLVLPPGIPAHFSFGIMNASGDTGLLDAMRAHNGTAWDFRYQYLSGGVNTGTGWETWNSPPGQFAANYLRESADHRYSPALVYYDLLQSHGSCDSCADQERDLSNLANPTVMSAYFANWRLLMQHVSAYGRPVLIIVEPDLWGFMQRSLLARSNSPTDIPASVASSGDPDTSRFPNTAQGYAWALLHIRDLYATNAVLALHLSPWANTDDIASSTSSSLDVPGTAQSIAQFLLAAGLAGTPSGVSKWDLLSSDVADHDSGQGAAWWDPTNTAFPNFARYLTFISDVTKLTGKRVIMWQVPEGNQYFDTENNTNHHTQDNRAQYILGHVADFARAGIVGVLFGPGNGGTMIDDTAHDGVTNPAPISSFQCDRCNNHISIYPDDDGGYLRLYVGAYYTHGPLQLANPGAWTPATSPNPGATATPLPSGTCDGQPRGIMGATSVSPNPASPGESVTVTFHITMSCDTRILVAFEASTPTMVLLQASADNVSATQGRLLTLNISAVVPAGATPGSYAISGGIYPAGGGNQILWQNNLTNLQVK